MLVRRGQRQLRNEVNSIGDPEGIRDHLVVRAYKQRVSRARAGIGIDCRSLKAVLAATSRASSVARAPPRLCPEMVRELTGFLKGSVDSAFATVGDPAAVPVLRELYMAVKPSSVLPAPTRNGHLTARNSASWTHSRMPCVPRMAMTTSPVVVPWRISPMETSPWPRLGFISVERSEA